MYFHRRTEIYGQLSYVNDKFTQLERNVKNEILFLNWHSLYVDQKRKFFLVSSYCQGQTFVMWKIDCSVK